LFVTFFCCQNEGGPKILDGVFTTLFQMNPMIENIIYFLPDSLILFPPFSSFRPKDREGGTTGKSAFRRSKVSNVFLSEYPAAPYCSFPYSLHICTRREFLPAFTIRRAKIEDCDDLMPLLRRFNMLADDKIDHFMSELLDNEESKSKSLVAEYNGGVVGFMKIVQNADQKLLRETYNLSLFNSLVKLTHVVTKSDLSSIENMPVEEQFIPPTMEELKVSNTFSILMFCIEKEHGPSSPLFLKFAFDLWPQYEYCAITASPETPENELLRHCSTVPPLNPQEEYF
jgi:hypothetical protein